jgi:hypothetical protein
MTMPVRVSIVAVTVAARASVNETARASRAPLRTRTRDGFATSDDSVLLSANARSALERRPWSSVAETVKR